MCGVDEAGKGPVVGDMFLTGFCIEEDRIKELIGIGVKDSKLLSPKKREEIYNKIVQISHSYKIISITPEEIDKRFENGTNLNNIECYKMSLLINELKPDKVIIDCPSPNIEGFRKKLEKQLTHTPKQLILEHKADYTYPVVAAASIVSKVNRDAHMRDIEKKLGLIIGSGYPSDEKTIKFLDTVFERKLFSLKKYIRKTWSTFQDKKAEKEQMSILDYESCKQTV